MARPNEYSNKRFMTMQIVMWGILLASVGVAALTTAYKRGAAVVKLGDRKSLDSVSVRLPKGWKITQDDDSIIAIEQRADPDWAREVLVRERSPRDLSLFEWFMDGAMTSPAQRAKGVTTIPMGAGSGELTVRVLAENRRIKIRRLQVVARSMLANKNELTISLTCLDEEGRDEPEAIDLVKDIAATVEPVTPK